ncbi:MAG: alpha/beta fold hydrolase [Steroidobacteraceae bacterium]|nr:alpha/beta fold hydrolase [Steroidobacteraceae bacterium]
MSVTGHAVRRRFVTLADGMQLHYRIVGAGPPVVLLHPSPQSGAFSLPMARRLAPNFTAIAVDTPGYGLSDPLPGRPSSPALADYLPPLRLFLDALGLARVALYGNATGAQIAQLFAHAHPERVALCMLDTAGHKEDADLDAMLEGYFPDVTPRRDGGHLLTHWDMVRSLSLFSPWQATDAGHRLVADLPSPAALHSKLLDYLRAGPAYAAAYRPAFYTAKHALISRIRVPVTLTRWEGKPDLAEVDALIGRGLPPNFTVLRAGPSPDERLAAAEAHLLRHYRPTAAPMPALPPQIDPGAVRWQSMFVDVPGGQLFARACLAGSGRPWLGLHDPAGSSRRVEPLLSPWLGARPLLAIDNPGNGESDRLLSREAISTEAYAAHAEAALAALGFDVVDALGRYSGGQVAMELARRTPQRVRHVVQAGVMIFAPDEREALLAHYTPSIEPRWDGSHLVTAWAIVRDMSLFWPWYDRRATAVIRRDAAIDAASLDRRVQDLLKIGDAWQQAYAASFRYPMQERLGALPVPCLLADYPGAASWPRLAMAAACSPRVALGEIDADASAWRRRVDRFLGERDAA